MKKGKPVIIATLMAFSLSMFAVATLSAEREKAKPTKECYAKCKDQKDRCLKNPSYDMNKKKKSICQNVYRQCMDTCNR